MDTTKGELSFVLNDVNYGVAYERIPLDKPLVPCVLLKYEGDSVELVIYETNASIQIPCNIISKSVTWDSITLTWDTVEGTEFYQIEVDGDILGSASPTNSFTKTSLLPETEHSFRVRTVKGNKVSGWSDIAKVKTLEKSNDFSSCMWRECPDNVWRKYSVDKNNPRIATNVNLYGWCTVIGNTPIPLNKITSWSIKILKSKKNNGNDIYIGIAPFDINQNEEDDNFNKCGWYYYCHQSSLNSGPPYYYWEKEYGPKKKDGEYVHTGGSVGVVMDTIKRELSFVVDGMYLGVAYEGIPLDKPLVPCVLLYYNGDSVELDLSSEVKENVDNSISVPSNITTKSSTWDTITLTWDAVEGAEFYQIEVDGSKTWDATIANTFTKKELLPKSVHSFRVRTVKKNKLSKWSELVKGRIVKKSFETSGWKECPGYVYNYLKYSVDENNPRIATNITYYCSTIIGNTLIPLNKVTSWSIKILKSEDNNGNNIYIGVAPSDIDQNSDDNRLNCGWYFYCGYYSSLYSGPPHNYDCKEYGPKKIKRKYVRTGDSFGVVMDTKKGELSFVLDGVNYGVAYERIPLDKPLVPCVILKDKGDSLEFDISEVKTNFVDTSISVPSNITAKSITWDSITLRWNAVEDVSFYQIEVDECISSDVPTTNTITKKGFLPETEHSFRVRVVKGTLLSEWSDIVKGKVMKTPDFSECVWKECPDYVEEIRKYSVDENNPRIAINTIFYRCTIIGNTPLPPNKVISWNIKILKSQENDDGGNIYIGVAPFDINQNEDNNYKKCGWYFDCRFSTLYSGPPHNYYKRKEYGPRKEDGKYVHTGDSIGIMMDTTKGELSFAVSNKNYGAAYRAIPLGKPLVPCVILKYEGDSVELII